jgi:autonomous glycyl radical cofactor GrcA
VGRARTLKLPYRCARDGISLTSTVTPDGLGRTRDERIGDLVGVLDGFTGTGGFHLNVNVLDRATLEDAMAHPENYPRFIKVAGGGVTISGGEPLQQPAFVREVFARCHDLRLHTALDTSGFLGDRADDALLDATDLVLLALKSGDPATYRRVTRAGRLAPTVRFAHRLAERGTPMWIRFVLVPGLTDDPANVAAIADLVAGHPLPAGRHRGTGRGPADPRPGSVPGPRTDHLLIRPGHSARAGVHRLGPRPGH